MGAGHDGVARQLGERLERSGFRVRTVDVWDLQPIAVGRLVTTFYRTIVARAPWLYELIYRIWLRPPPARRRAPISPVTRWAERRLASEVTHARPDVVISTFHVGTQMLGNLRMRGVLTAPAASYCVDFAGHGLWVNPGVDANLCLHPLQASRLAASGARGLRVVGPVVREGFRAESHDPATTRRRFEVHGHDKTVLVVAGSWGAGRVDETVAALEDLGTYRVIVVTGTNEALRHRLAARYPHMTVLGWVDRMEELVLGADVVVENAGGLSAMEAVAASVPVISYLPIPGHGRENVQAMSEAGVSAYAHDKAELGRLLAELADDSPRRKRMLNAGRRMLAPDPVEEITDLAGVAEGKIGRTS